MPRIAFTLPVMPGKQEECIRLLKKYKADLDKAHKAVGCSQWVKYITNGGEYFEFIDWKGARSFRQLLEEYLARPEMTVFLKEIGPHVVLPTAPPGKNQNDLTAQFIEGRAFSQAYHLAEPPA